MAPQTGFLRRLHPAGCAAAIRDFSKNKSAAKRLLAQLSQPSAIEKLVVASGGYNCRPSATMKTLKVGADAGPPKGTLYRYPNPYDHRVLPVAVSNTAQQIYAQGTLTKMTRAPSAGRANGGDPDMGGTGG